VAPDRGDIAELGVSERHGGGVCGDRCAALAPVNQDSFGWLGLAGQAGLAG
jgi:hypothetical protein